MSQEKTNVGQNERSDQQGVRQCPECGQRGNGPFCHHWDGGVERKIPTLIVGHGWPRRPGTVALRD